MNGEQSLQENEESQLKPDCVGQVPGLCSWLL